MSNHLKYITFLLSIALCSFNTKGIRVSTSLVDEICDNAIDDDNDGLIDLNDPDCTCDLIEVISLIDNPSFEDLECCPYDRSQLDCATGWIQASEPTTDLIHLCDWLGWDDFPPPQPFPDGEGIMGFRDGRVLQQNNPQPQWKEYAGACLLGPLKKDSTYKFQFDVGFSSPKKSPPINITFFGTPDCVNLPFGTGDDFFGCPTNGPGWVKLGSTWVAGSGGNKWVQSEIIVIPDMDIAAIAIGPECAPIPAENSLYYFFDNLILADINQFDLQVGEINHPCKENFKLQIPNLSNFQYQWYKDGIALIGEISSELSQVYGEGNYQVRIIEGNSCRVSEGYSHTIPYVENEVALTICKEDVFQFGDQLLSEPGEYVDTFLTKNNCDSIVYLTLSKLGEKADSISHFIFEGESYTLGNKSFTDKGEYLVTLISEQGCDSLIHLQLELYDVYFPNVFSPNGDGINDIFKVAASKDLIQKSNLFIYNRWGELIFNGDAWNGKQKDRRVNPGVFTYVAVLTMNDGIERSFYGSLTVIR